jgi:SNF2 family DNA or RNA helicase
MINLRKKDNNSYYLEYTGELGAKYKLLRLLAPFSFQVKRIDENNWIVSKESADYIANILDTEYIINPWEDIGQGLKYEPYDDQKETVHIGMNNGSSLFLLPCGAGKSFIAITLYHEMKVANKIASPALIVVPASLKYQWVKEVSKFSNYIAHSIDTPSKMKKKFDAQFEDCDLLICNYETLKNKSVAEKLLDMNIDLIIVDEAQNCSNYKSERSKALYQFNDVQYCYAMTATPIQNNPENLFGIFNFVDPDLFVSHGKFASNYIVYKGYGLVGGVKNVEHLKQKIKPYIFMKSEEEVASQLPELVITPIYCQMDRKILAVHQEIMQDLDIARKAAESIENKITNPKLLESNKEYQQYKAQILAYQTFAQELADDPRLLSMSDSKMANKYSIDTNSPKLDVLLELVGQIIDSGETVCIFTKFERMQRLINQAISKKYKDIGVAIVNGSMTAEERFEQAYTLFQDNDKYKVLIMTSAGTTGISLSKCKNLIEYDLADSYADMTQRHGRVKRSDSVSKISNIYQLILSDSWDEIQLKIINKKEKYDTEIIKSLKE